MVPIEKEDLMAEDQQRALRYLMFIKEIEMGQEKQEGVQIVDHNCNTWTKKTQAPQQCHWRP